MNALRVNKDTGFIESPSTANLMTFDSDKKLKLLDICKQIRQKGSWPDLEKVADAVGISSQTLQRHLRMDPKFAEAFQNITLGAKWSLETLMYDMASKNPMYMFGWLRKFFPDEYDPARKVIVSHQSAVNHHATAIDAEIVDDK